MAAPLAHRWSGWSLRRRLLLAFTVVAAAAVALVTAAALVGTTRGLSAQLDAERRELATRAAAVAGDAYRHAAGWDGADLGPAIAVAAGGNARLVVRNAAGQVVTTTAGRGRGGGAGMGVGGGAGTPLIAPVDVDGRTVGTVTLGFPGAAVQAGRPVAWTWVGVAALAALALAVVAAWLITRMLTRPLATLTNTARAFAGGDRDARTGLRAPGELGELAAAFDAAAAQVQLAEQARRQMSADVAHELRTPLAALQAGLEELRDGLAPADAAALARLHDQALRLSRVVADLADLSAAEAARLTLRPEPVDLAAVATDAAQAHLAPLRAAGITLVQEPGAAVPVRGDAGRLHQVIGNLLQNCARHCRPGDTVTLSVEALPDPRVARLTVTDTGPGISPDDLPHVFTRFWRARDGGGTGLGMPIVRSIVEAHDGTVRVESVPGAGTSVIVEVPLDTAVPGGSPADPRRPAGIHALPAPGVSRGRESRGRE